MCWKLLLTMNSRRPVFLLSALTAVLFGTAYAQDTLPISFVCSESNDLYRLMTAEGREYKRYDSAVRAFAEAPEGSGVLVLADGYPARTTVLDGTLDYAGKRRLRVYVEYPDQLPDLEVDLPRGQRYARAVVASDDFGPGLQRMRILEINDGRFVPVAGVKRPLVPWLVFARVAGLDRAVFGLPKSAVSPILFEHPTRAVLVATTKLSQFVTARYAPRDAWAAVWKRVLEWLAPGHSIPALHWTLVAEPSYGRNGALPTASEDGAFRRGVAWFFGANLLIHPSWKQGDDLEPFLPMNAPIRRGPPFGDGSAGMAEGLNGRVTHDGSQTLNYFIRNDCMGEATFVFALSSLIDGERNNGRIAANLADYVYLNSILAQGPRDDPKSPSFGLVGGAARRASVDVYYGDDAARSALGVLGASAALKSDRWDERLLRLILANFRTSGKLGFREWRLEEHCAPPVASDCNGLQDHGWRYFYDKETVRYQPHYEAYPWALQLWTYQKTGYKPLLDRTSNGIRMMMEAYPDHWHWTNGMQQERARMLLPLAWLVRVEDTPQHRQWLKFIAQELLSRQDVSGAIREEIGAIQNGDMKPPRTNEEYGTNEAPLIQQNGEPIADMLYTTDFAFLGLHEAAAATKDPFYADAERRLADFLCRIQVRSKRPELDGAWFRAFDYSRWDYWGSNSDLGWSAWSVESGWTQTWITSVFGMRHLKTSLWDMTAGSQIGTHMAKLQGLMFPEK